MKTGSLQQRQTRAIDDIKSNVLAGLTSSFALVPECIAFALVAQVNPLMGLYGAFMICTITALFGGRPGMISGAAGSMAVVIVALVVQHGAQYLLATVVLSGLMMAMFGLLKLGKLTRASAMERAADLLKQLELGDKIRRPANRLSGGEQQRVAIARALANEPAVLLADEPTGNLDRRNSERVAVIFEELALRGQAIVMVTHDGALARRAARMITMEDGVVISDESPAAATATRPATVGVR